MVVSLTQQSAAAEDDAAALQVFLDEMPIADRNIQPNVDLLLELAGLLRGLEEELRYEVTVSGPIQAPLLDTIRIVLLSFEQTHVVLNRDLFQQPALFGRGSSHQALWNDLERQLRREGMKLKHRLELYRGYLDCVSQVLSRNPIDQHRFRELRRTLFGLLRLQDPLSSGFDQPRIAEPDRWNLPVRPRSRPGLQRTQSFHQPNHAGGWQVPPPAPEVDSSPNLTTASVQTQSSWSSSSPNDDGSQEHWAMRIFDRVLPGTPFRSFEPRAHCFGHPDVEARSSLQRERFVKVLRVPLTDPSHNCRLFWRPDDNRARIIISRSDPFGLSLHYCRANTALRIRRRGPRLYLYRYNIDNREYVAWAKLPFPTYESQVLFYCTFVALKRQDSASFSEHLVDDFPDETLLFAGTIEDDNYLHTLKLLKDAFTGAVRLLASPSRGPMVHTPIWTAFITDLILNRIPPRVVTSTILELDPLKTYVFCPSYTPPRVAGRQRLNFVTERDADDFYRTLRQLY